MTVPTDEELTVEQIDAMSDEEFDEWIDSWAGDLDPEEYSREAWEECMADARRAAKSNKVTPKGCFHETLEDMFACMEARIAQKALQAE